MKQNAGESILLELGSANEWAQVTFCTSQYAQGKSRKSWFLTIHCHNDATFLGRSLHTYV